MPTMRILILSDGRPGHFNLSEGIAAALGRLGTTSISRMEVTRGAWSGAILAGLTRLHLTPAAMLQKVYGLSASQLPAADIVVSAGAETLAANVWIARHLGCRNVFYGSLRWFEPTDFTLVLTSYARNATHPRHALALKPSPLDPATFPHPDKRGAKSGKAPARIALLIGGDAGTFHYSQEDWSRLERLVHDTSAYNRTRWLISNSRRTPADVSDRLTRLAHDRPDVLETFVDVRLSGSGTLASILGASAAAVCTADSSSMLSECVWCRLPVVALSPVRSHLPPDEQLYRTWLAENRWTTSLALSTATPASLLASLAALSPPPGNPLDELATLLRPYLGVPLNEAPSVDNSQP